MTAAATENRNISRKTQKHVLSEGEGAALCHFDRREKSFSDPSHSLGMTGLVPSLGVLGVLAMASLMGNHALRLRAGALKLVAEHFSWDKASDRTIAALSQ